VPVLTASSAVEGASGIRVPVDIKGHFDNIKIKPDYGSLIQDAINNPDAIKGTLKGAKEQLKDVKGSLKELKKDPAKALNALFGGGLAPAAKEQPADAAPAEAAPAADNTVPAPAADSEAPVPPASETPGEPVTP